MLVPFAEDATALGLHVDVSKPETADLADAEAGVEHQKKGFVTPGVL